MARYHFKNHHYLLFNEAVATQLVVVGVKEIRFDLAATEFAPKIIRKFRVVRKFFRHIRIEAPSLPGTLASLTKYMPEISGAGVDQINLCEVVINQHNVKSSAGVEY